MCDGGATMIILSILSAGVGMAAQQQAADAARTQAEYAAQMASRNAEMARRNAARGVIKAQKTLLAIPEEQAENVRAEMSFNTQLRLAIEGQNQKFAKGNVLVDQKSFGSGTGDFIDQIYAEGRSKIKAFRKTGQRSIFALRQGADDLMHQSSQYGLAAINFDAQGALYSGQANRSSFLADAASITAGLTGVMAAGQQNRRDGKGFWGFKDQNPNPSVSPTIPEPYSPIYQYG